VKQHVLLSHTSLVNADICLPSLCAAAPVVDTATVAELSQVKAAKSELDSRVAALEAQLQAAAVARAASEAKEADLVQALEVRSFCVVVKSVPTLTLR